VVIVAGIGQRALDNLVYHGVEVQVGPSGAPVTELVAGYFAGRLPRALEGCEQQHGPAAPAHECQLAPSLEQQPADTPDESIRHGRK
jgi:predicted Fe-Mo cluster-binding NifX family protein